MKVGQGSKKYMLVANLTEKVGLIKNECREKGRI